MIGIATSAARQKSTVMVVLVIAGGLFSFWLYQRNKEIADQRQRQIYYEQTGIWPA
jgi:hypothetical protein